MEVVVGANNFSIKDGERSFQLKQVSIKTMKLSQREFVYNIRLNRSLYNFQVLYSTLACL